MSKIKDENFFQVSGWMLNKLQLKGNELCVFAIIYGFSQDNESWFCGSRKYIADFIGATTVTVDNCLANLVKKGLIQKRVWSHNGAKTNQYRTEICMLSSADTPTKNFDTPQKNLYTKNFTPLKNSCTPPLQKILTNNKEYYNKDLNNRYIYNAHEEEEQYPLCVEDIIAIAQSPFVGMPCTTEQAEAYYLTRARTGWYDANNNKISAKAVPLDLKNWLLRDQNKQRKQKGQYTNGRNITDNPADYGEPDNF